MRTFSCIHLIIRIQNQANIFFAGNLGQHAKRLVLRDLIKFGLITLEHVPSKENRSNHLTKSLGRLDLEAERLLAGIVLKGVEKPTGFGSPAPEAAPPAVSKPMKPPRAAAKAAAARRVRHHKRRRSVRRALAPLRGARCGRGHPMFVARLDDAALPLARRRLRACGAALHARGADSLGGHVYCLT